eukprot:9853299-Alexandrium_andersonii.AAC.1
MCAREEARAHLCSFAFLAVLVRGRGHAQERSPAEPNHTGRRPGPAWVGACPHLCPTTVTAAALVGPTFTNGPVLWPRRRRRSSPSSLA